MTGLFAEWQPRYAEHRVATFPVAIDGKAKKPRIHSWMRVGLRGSAQLALKFADADAFAFQCGKHSRIPLVDIDTTDEKMVMEAERLFGSSPIIWRTGSGNHAMPFRHNGEARRIRPVPGLPIDILGAGLAVAPPSLGAKGRYEFLQGGLADLDRLPRLQVGKVEPESCKHELRDTIPDGIRNHTLFRFALRQAPHVDDLDALLDVVRTRNMDCLPPIPDAEVVKTATSAWRYEITGSNWVGRKAKAVTDLDEILALRHDPHAALLLSFLRVNYPIPNDAFAIDQVKVAALLGWNRRTVNKRIHTLIQLGLLKRIHRGKGIGDPHLYRLKTLRN
jgi:hypothetical protein